MNSSRYQPFIRCVNCVRTAVVITCLFFVFSLPGLTNPSDLNAEGYKQLLSRFHAYVDDGVLPCTVILLEKNGSVTQDLYGYQDLETHKQINEKSIFRWASMTKPITAVAVMMLVEDGKLALDDNVSQYIPAVAGMTVFGGDGSGRSMTIRHLLSHMSGSTSMFDFSNAGRAAANVFAGRQIGNLEQLVEVICETDLAFEPGHGWAYGYSNDLLAYIVEKVSGLAFDRFITAHILKPLGMTATGFQAHDKDLLTTAYAMDANRTLAPFDTPAESRYLNGKNYARGNGGLSGPAGDYLRFCEMILNRGHLGDVRILQPQSVELMMTNAVPETALPLKIAGTPLKGQGYGLGFGIALESSPSGTPGDVYWPGSLYTTFFISPKNNGIAILMTQLHDPSRMDLIWEFHELATKALR